MSKPIRIDAPRLEDRLEELQRRWRARTISAYQLEDAAKEAEARLEKAGIPKRDRPGATATLDPWSVPKSYGYAAEGSVAHLVRKTGGWYLDRIERTYVRLAALANGGLRVRVAPKGRTAVEAIAAGLRQRGIDLTLEPEIVAAIDAVAARKRAEAE